MSGGVDSAVALHRAGPDAVGVTLRLWLDPAGPDAERACCSPDAVIRARETCHALGLPHVTLDLREEFRRTVVASFVDGYAAGLTPNPCMRCNGAFRFAALVAFAERAGAERPLDRALRPPRRARRPATRRAAADPAKDQSYMLATVEPRLLDRVGFPLGNETKADVRAEAAAAGLAAATGRRARRRASSRAATTAPSSSGRASRPDRGRSSTRTAASVGRHDGIWRFTPGQRRGLGDRVARSRCTRSARTPSTNTLVVGPRRSLGDDATVEARGTLYVAVDHVEAKLRYRSPAVAARRHGDGRRVRARARRAGRGRRARPGRRPLRRRRRRRSGSDRRETTG